MKTQQHEPVMQAVGEVSARVSALAAALRELVVAETLTTVTVQVPPNGSAQFDWSAGFASVAVTNCTPDTVTVTTATAADVAPATGTGVAKVPAGKGATHNLAGHALTLYGGATGGPVTLSVFARPQTPAWG